MTSLLEFCARTDSGMVRQHNEDSIAIQYLPDRSAGLAILADGMGGHNAGEVASALAVSVVMEAIGEQLQQILAIPWPSGADLLRQRLVDSVKLANWTIFNAASESIECAGMGTTLIVALFHHDRLTVAHVGDSRLYRLREGILHQVTNDHSVLQEQIDAGLISLEEAQFSLNKNVITRALGVESDVMVDVYELECMQDDLYLICSDGLSDMLLNQEIKDDLLRFIWDRELAAQALIDHANTVGGRDNISVILVKQQDGELEDQSMGQIARWIA